MLGMLLMTSMKSPFACSVVESRMDELIGITFERNEGSGFKAGPNTGMQAWWTEGTWGQSVGQQMVSSIFLNECR